MKVRAPFSELRDNIKGITASSNGKSLNHATRSQKISITKRPNNQGDYITPRKGTIQKTESVSRIYAGSRILNNSKRGRSLPAFSSNESPSKSPLLKRSNRSIQYEKASQLKATVIKDCRSVGAPDVANENTKVARLVGILEKRLTFGNTVSTTSIFAASESRTESRSSWVEAQPADVAVLSGKEVDITTFTCSDHGSLGSCSNIEKTTSEHPNSIVRVVSYNEDNTTPLAAQDSVTEVATHFPRPLQRLRRKYPELLDYWHTSEAKKLFAAAEEETARAAIARHIAALEGVSESTWRAYCVPNAEYMSEDLKMNNVTTMASYLLAALYIANDELSNGTSFIECCNQAILFLSDVPGLAKIEDGSKLYLWFIGFRTSRKFNVLRSQKLDVSYWESSDAQDLFGVEDGENVKGAIYGYITHLQKFQVNFNELLVDEQFHSLYEMTPRERNMFVSKVVYVVRALANAVRHMPGISWRRCCDMACRQLKGCEGFHNVASSNTVQAHFQEYLSNGQKFHLVVGRPPAPTPETAGCITKVDVARNQDAS